MKTFGCDCTVCTRKRRTLFEVVFWLLFAVLIGFAAVSVFWR